VAETAQLEASGEGAWRLSGPLDFATVPDLFDRFTPQLDGVTEARIDLAGVTRADTAGLALLVEWMRLARARGGRVRFSGWPAKFHALARVSGLQKALDID